MKSADNPDGPLTPDKAQQKKAALAQDRSDYFDQFTRDFYSADGVLQVSEAQRGEAITLCQQSAQHAALACMDSFGNTDFREDLKKVTVPTLVIHGEADAIVPFEGSGQRTHLAVPHSTLVKVRGAPHGLNLSHAQAFNEALLASPAHADGALTHGTALRLHWAATATATAWVGRRSTFPR